MPDMACISQSNSPIQRYHLGDQKVDHECLDAIAILQRPRHGLRTIPLGSGAALGAVLDFRVDLYLYNREFDIAQDTLFTSRWFDVSERSVPQLSQTPTVEISSTVVVSKFSPVIAFSAALVSRFFLEDFLVSSLSVCDGGMLEFVLVFLVVFSRKMAITIPNRRHNPLKTTSASLEILPSFRSESMSAL